MSQSPENEAAGIWKRLFDEGRRDWWLAALVTAAAAVYMAGPFDAEWIPHDAGTLAHQADRALDGEIPHIDFDELYTGGLTYLYAGACLVFGNSLRSIRLLLFLCACIVVPFTYWLARRACSRPTATLTALLCVLWTVPNYEEGMPSWFNLFFALLGICALFRYVETDRRRYAFLAGVAGGASVAVKSIGLYYIAAAGLALLFHEQQTARLRLGAGRSRALSLSVSALLLVFAAMILGLVLRLPSFMGLLHFALPGFAIVAVLLCGEWRLRDRDARERLARLGRTLLPFCAGVLAPPAVLLIPYVLHGGLPALFSGVFVAPQARLTETVHALPPPHTLVAAVPLAAILSVGILSRRLWGGWWAPLALAVAGGGLAALVSAQPYYIATWNSVRPIAPLLVLACCVRFFAPAPRSEDEARKTTGLFILAGSCAILGLVQFPFSVAIYFCFFAPVVALTASAWMSGAGRSARPLLAGVAAFYATFAVLWTNPADPYELGFRYRPSRAERRLDLPRGGLHIPEQESRLYEALVSEIHRHSGPGDHIYAAPDSPEVYYLAERPNPMRTVFDFLDRDYYGPPDARARRIMTTLEEKNVKVIAIRLETEFGRLDRTHLLPALMRRYPQGRIIGPFAVRWRVP